MNDPLKLLQAGPQNTSTNAPRIDSGARPGKGDYKEGARAE